MTVCNMSIEAGARAPGAIAPDPDDIRHQEAAPRPRGRRLGSPLQYWSLLASDEDAIFDMVLEAMISSPSSPGAPTPARAFPLSAAVPSPEGFTDETAAPCQSAPTVVWYPDAQIARQHGLHHALRTRTAASRPARRRQVSSRDVTRPMVCVMVVPGSARVRLQAS